MSGELFVISDLSDLDTSMLIDSVSLCHHANGLVSLWTAHHPLARSSTHLLFYSSDRLLFTEDLLSEEDEFFRIIQRTLSYSYSTSSKIHDRAGPRSDTGQFYHLGDRP